MQRQIQHTMALLFLAMVVALPCTAQSLSVDTFMVTNETDALVPATQRLDRNRQTAALVKIVTSERGFSFSGGLLGLVGDVVQKEGEIWVYVPREAEHLTISHPTLGRIDGYAYPFIIEGGKTYRLYLGIEGGRHVNISGTNASQADVWIDGEYMGRAPIVGKFLRNGRRNIRAQQNKFEADTLVNITDGRGRVDISLNMKDMSSLYGQVEVRVADDAEIVFQGHRVGHGTWHSEVREGQYTVITRRTDCDSAVTVFNVKRGQLTRVQANAPVPHTGELRLFLRTRNVAITESNHKTYSPDSPIVPVGTYHLNFSRKGYQSQDIEYTVRRNQVTADTVALTPISYLKGRRAFYFGLGYTVRSLSGLTGMLGTVFHHFDLSLGYTLGLTSSNALYWYDQAGLLQSGLQYKMNTWNVRLGYQIDLISRLGLTPLVGFQHQQLSGKLLDGTTKYGDGAKAISATLGLRLFYVPVNHFILFAQPEYALVLKKDATYNTAAQKADFSKGGFGATIGAMFNF